MKWANSALSMVAPNQMWSLSTWNVACATENQHIILFNFNLNSYTWLVATILHSTSLNILTPSLIGLANSCSSFKTQFKYPPTRMTFLACFSFFCGRYMYLKNIHLLHSIIIILWRVDPPTRWDSPEVRDSLWLISKSLVECLAHENYLTNICWMLEIVKPYLDVNKYKHGFPGRLLPREGFIAFTQEVANQIWPSYLVVFCHVYFFFSGNYFLVLEIKISNISRNND